MTRNTFLLAVVCVGFLLVGCENNSNKNVPNSTEQTARSTSISEAPATATTITQDQEIQFNKKYPFQATLPFLKLTGFSHGEFTPGLWTTATSATVTIYVTPTLLQKHPTGNIKFMVQPLTTKDIMTQNITLHWEKNHEQSDALNIAQWITLPYTAEDWQNVTQNTDHLKALTIQLDLPDATTPKSLSINDDERTLALRFIKLSLTN